MAVSFIHTADWQIGKTFGRFPEETRVLLARQRIDTIHRIAELARDRGVDAVLVAGDVFDTHAVADKTLRQTMLALAPFRGPWVMLPGNHDPVLAESPWSRLRRLGAPDNLVLATEPRPIVLAGGALTVLPAPLVRRHEAADLTDWFDGAAVTDGEARVGLAHGSVAAFLPEQADAPNPIAHDRAERAGLDYLALGDWHGTLKVCPRTWYSGTPEPDRFRDNDQGNVLHVRLAGARSAPEIEPVACGHYRWHTLSVTVHAARDVDDIARAVEALASPPKRCVVRLTLDGSISLDTRVAVDEALAVLAATVAHLEVDDRHLVAQPSDDDLDLIDRIGFVRSAIDRLRARAGDPADPEREAARLALEILYLEHRRLGGDER